MGRFARGKGTQSYEARFSPSRSPFPGTSLFCVMIWGNVLANACILLYWPCTSVPMVCTVRKAVCVADLFLFDVYLETNLFLVGVFLEINLFLAVLFWDINLFLAVLSQKTKLLPFCHIPESITLPFCHIPGNRPATRAAFPSGGTKKSAQPDTTDTAAYRTKPIN